MTSINYTMNSPLYLEAAEKIAQVGRFLAEKGWSPATSSNYSQKLSQDQIAITRSGIDKHQISPQDVIVINMQGQVLESHQKASAETLIHTSIYKCRPEAHAVLHTHSPMNTRLSLKFSSKEVLTFQGYEMQKGIEGCTTHESTLEIPILANSQNMVAFASTVENLLIKQPEIYGFLIAGHGLYTWGSTLEMARRHVETFEFLFECKVLELSGV